MTKIQDHPFTEEEFEAFQKQSISAMNALIVGQCFEEIANGSPVVDIDENMMLMSELCADLHNFNGHLAGSDESTARWVVEAEDRTPEDPVLLYSHGGAFCLGLSPVMVKMAADVYRSTGNPRLSVLIFDYTVAVKGPDSKYPRQLDELSQLVNALSETCDVMYLMGDSAGGLMSTNFCRHVVLPFTGVEKVPAKAKPTGLVLISPWSHLHPDTTKGSYVPNFDKDMASLNIWCQFPSVAFSSQESFEREAFNLAEDSVDWDTVLPNHDNVFVSYGEYEMQKSDVLKFVNNAKLNDGKATVYMEPKGLHDSAAFPTKPSPLIEVIANFLKRVL